MLDAVVCPGAIRQCPSLHSCCSVPGSDEVHCCPAGYSCEKEVKDNLEMASTLDLNLFFFREEIPFLRAL